MNAQLTVGESLLNSVEKYPEKAAIVFEGRVLTYRELNKRVNRLSNGLLSLGLGKGDKVAILLGNCPEILEIMLAVGKIGITAVPVNFRFVGREIEYIINQSDSTMLIIGSEYLPNIKDVRQNFSRVKHYLAVGQGAEGMHNYEEFLGKYIDREPNVEVLETDPWYIGYTSGTTGFPKGAVISHRARVLGALYLIIEFGLRDDDVQLMVMPLFHSNGLLFSLAGFILGNTIQLVRHFNPEEVLRTIEQGKTSYASMVPTMYNMLLTLPDHVRQSYDVSSMRVLISSSSPLLTKTKEEIISFFRGAMLNEFYGSTEAGIVTNLKPRDQMRKIRCVGPAMFGVKVKLLDKNGQEVPPGEVGELFSFGQNFDGYYKMPEATKASFRGDWFSAGDMARMDEEGYFYIVDRKNDMIISGGENIYPVEIEEVLSQHPVVLESAVIGVPDEKWGESVKALIILKPGMQASEEEIIEFCRNRLAGYKRPKSVEFVSSFPKNPTGKILKRIIRNQYWEGQEAKI